MKVDQIAAPDSAAAVSARQVSAEYHSPALLKRRRRVLEVIERHLWPAVDPDQDPEGHLLEIATGLDISGARAEVLTRPFVDEVLARFPRLDLAAEFTACLTDQAARKPETAAGRLVVGGLADRLAHHPLGEANSVNDPEG